MPLEQRAKFRFSMLCSIKASWKLWFEVEKERRLHEERGDASCAGAFA